MLTNAGEHVEDLPLFRAGIRRSIARNHANAKPPSHFDDMLVSKLLIAPKMPVQFGPGMLTTEDQECRFQRRPAFRPCKTRQARRELGNLLRSGRTFTLHRRPKLQTGDQTAKVGIPFGCLTEKRINGSVGASNFRSDMSLYPELFGGEVLPNRAVDSVAVEHSDRGHIEPGSYFNQFLGLGSSP